MTALKKRLLTYLFGLIFCISPISFPNLANAAGSSMQDYDQTLGVVPDAQKEEQNFFAMIGDFLIARPLLIGATAVGTAMFVASLPFTALGGNVKEAENALVAKPSQATFTRCLGCRMNAPKSKKPPRKNKNL